MPSPSPCISVAFCSGNTATWNKPAITPSWGQPVVQKSGTSASASSSSSSKKSNSVAASAPSGSKTEVATKTKSSSGSALDSDFGYRGAAVFDAPCVL